jgi:hypothetical protein
MNTHITIHSLEPEFSKQAGSKRLDVPCPDPGLSKTEVIVPLRRKVDLYDLEKCLRGQSMLKLEGDHRGEILRVVSGVAWITQAGSPEDIYLPAGKSMTIEGSGVMLIQGMDESRLKISRRRGPRARHAIGKGVQRITGWLTSFL